MAIHRRKTVYVLLSCVVCVLILIATRSNSPQECHSAEFLKRLIEKELLNTSGRPLATDSAPSRFPTYPQPEEVAADTETNTDTEVSSAGTSLSKTETRKPIVWLRYFKAGETMSNFLEIQNNEEYINEIKELPQNTFRAEILQSFGFEVVYGPPQEWDFLMTNINTWEMTPYQLLPYQKVSVIPGLHQVVNKQWLMIKHFPFMPKSFTIPFHKDQYHDYMKANPEAKFLKKTAADGGLGVQFVSQEAILSAENETKNIYIQEYIDNPILVDNRKIELAIYAAVVSVNPLRIYVYNADWYIRLCGEKYHPFDINNKDKYVLQSDKHMKMWEMPAFAHFDEYSITQKEAFYIHLEHAGYNLSALESNMKNITRTVFVQAEGKINKDAIPEIEKYGTVRNFYHLVRLDFVIDTELQPHLLEVNSFPAVSVVKRPRNREQYTRMLPSLFHLIGIRNYEHHVPYNTSWLDDGRLVIHRDLTTFNKVCFESACKDNCDKPECEFCGPCISEEDAAILADAFREHSLRYDWNRVSPKPFESQQEAMRWQPDKDPEYLALEPKSRWMSRWFWGKCLQNELWCK